MKKIKKYCRNWIKILDPRFLSVFTLVGILFCVSAAGSAQQIGRQYVTLDLKGVTLSVLFEEMMKQTDYRFFFNDAQEKNVKEVSISVKHVRVDSVLNQVFKNSRYTYRIIGTQVAIVGKPVQLPGQSVRRTNVTLLVKDSVAGIPLVGVACILKELGIYAVTDINGVAVLQQVPLGKTELELQILGYENYKKGINVEVNYSLEIRMIETSLALDEVNVVATKNEAGQATSSKIGRQAIDHLQATSLADLMQLLPGQLLKQNSDMTSPEQFYLRTLNSDKNNAFGVSIMVDGIPMSNDVNLNSNEFNVVGGGYDLRKIGTDNIESVEVIRGVPSVEYGDLSAGAVIVKTSVGKSPYQARVKVNPSIIQASLGKGWRLGDKGGFLNGSFDYLKSSGDPRKKTNSFDRINASAAYMNTFGIWRMTTRFGYSGIIDNVQQDPDEVDNGTYTESKDYTLKFSHEGSFSFNSALSRTLRYNVGVTTGRSDYFTSKIVSSSTGRTPIFTAKEEGIHEAILLPASYATSGGTIGKPLSVFAKVSNDFFVKAGLLNQRFNMGVEYRYSKNSGKGDYNTDDALPLKPTSARPRGFDEIPALNQLSAYFEDNIMLNIDECPVTIQAGVRYTVLQPGKSESVWSLSPRVNLSFSPVKWLDVKAAFGKNAKTPGLTHLYPDLKYVDRMIVNYGTGNPDEQYMLYDTRIIHVNNSKLKNSTTTRYEVGFDVKLPKDRMISISAFRDKNDLGFGSLSQYITYAFDYYDISNGGVVPNPEGGKPTVDYSKPFRRDTVMTTTGEMGNTSGSVNEGVELEINLGKINPIRTDLYLRGGYTRSELYSSAPLYTRPVGYSGDVDTSPFRIAYSSKLQKDIDKQFSTQLQAVCHIPKLKIVGSATFQVIWYNYSKSTNSKRIPMGYLDNKLVYHEITQAMLDDPDYKIQGYKLQDQIIDPQVSDAIKQPVLWLMNFRLTKNISDFAGFSFYVNNLPYYEPWQHSNQTKTLSERNKNTFAFGVELSIKL